MQTINETIQSGKKKKKKGKKTKRWKALFTDKFIDLVIVIVSILIAYELTVWQNESDHRATEKYYLESMLGDVDKDIIEMEQNLTDIKKDSTVVANYLKHIDEWPLDSLSNVLFNVFSLETFTYNNNTYQSLVSSNGLNTFSDRELRTQITEYYNLYVTVFRFEEVYTDVIFKINDYYVDNVDYVSRKVIRHDRIDKLTTKNFLVLATVQLADASEVYRDGLIRAKYLKRSLKNSF